MYERYILVFNFASPSHPARILRFKEDVEGDLEVNGDEIPLINDLDGNGLATGSNAFMSAGVQVASDYEAAVINRLDTITVSAILSTCFLFLLFLRSHRR